MDNFQEKKLLNTVEAGRYLRVKNQTLCNWRHRCVGPDYVKLGKNVLYEVVKLDEFINQHRVSLARG